MSSDDIYSILVLSILLLLIVFVMITRKKRIDFLLIFNFSYIIFFVLIPIIIIISPNLLHYGTPANWAYHFDAYRNNLVSAAIYAFLFYLFFIIIYSLISKKRFITKGTEKKVSMVNQDILFVFGIVFLIVGIASFFIYSTTMGGPVSAIVNAQLKRSGVFETVGVLTFFKHFMRSIYFSLFVFYTTNPNKKIYKSIRGILLLISIIFSIIVLLAYSGRANIVILLATVLFYENVLNNKIFTNKGQLFKCFTFISVFGIISAFYRPFMLILSGREIIFYNAGALMSIWTSIVKAFSVPMISMMLAIEKFSFNEISMGLGIFQIFIDIIPKSIISPERVYTINNLNTELFGFVLDSRNYNINSGLLAYFYYEFYWAGILLGSTITAIVIKISDDLIRYLRGNNTIGIMMVYFLFNLPNRIIAGDQVGGIKSLLILYLEFLLVFVLVKTTKTKTGSTKNQQALNKIYEERG